jgi:hypothetical protein
MSQKNKPADISPGKGDTDREAKERTPLRESELKSFAGSNNKVNNADAYGINGDYK